MAFHEYGEIVKVPRNEHVDLHVRTLTLNAEAPSERVECVEMREFLKEPEVYGNGLVVPLQMVPDLRIALDRVAPKKVATQS